MFVKSTSRIYFFYYSLDRLLSCLKRKQIISFEKFYSGSCLIAVHAHIHTRLAHVEEKSGKIGRQAGS